ncbi:hypothetical protein FRC20_005047 [Serendipita sp. 405]|nr:hypothetical protein FRC15_002239 [Serendipita sp. 397]KAG8841429.1 hypothetical protein FRC20_005047 [Serendipita sp. 405]
MRFFLLPLLTFIFINSCSGSVLKERATPASVAWGGCLNQPQTAYECANVDVPLDWQDASKGTVPIYVSRYPATKLPRKGYMFYNPGGPGLSGSRFIQSQGKLLQAQLGLDWDVISWDPRGVLLSGPTIQMFNNNNNEDDDFWGQLQGLGNYNTHGNLTVAEDAQFFMSQASKFDNMTIAFNNATIQKNGDNLKYVGTCAVVRDLVYLVDSIYGEGSDVNFWGISYGTVIGVYLTQMFPERVGKVILDGVYDAEKQANLAPMKWLDQDYKGVESALIKWTEACAAGTGPTCGFASETGISTSDGILSKIKQMLDTAHRTYDGTSVTASSINDDIRHWPYEYILQIIRTQLYDQSSWSWLDRLFLKLLKSQSGTSSSFKDIELDSRFFKRGPATYGFFPEIYEYNYVNFAVYCGDTIDPQGETTQDLFTLTVQAAQSVSPNFASLTPAYSPRSFCHNWKARAVERLPQPMTKKPKNVVLVIGNVADPLTPYENAQRLASSAFLGAQARLVKFNTGGHSSFSGESDCINDVVRNYTSGNPPKDAGNEEEDVVCTLKKTAFGRPPLSWGGQVEDSASEASRTLVGMSLLISTVIGMSILMF